MCRYHDIAAHCDSDMVGGISQSFVSYYIQ